MASAMSVFDSDQAAKVQRLLAHRVALMGGRKLEEADWTDVYTAALDIPRQSWSNLDIDVVHGNRGVEQKAMRVKYEDIADACGTTLMHPSLTRSIRISSSEPAAAATRSVLEQYGEVVAARTAAVQKQNDTGDPADMRMGWLLWQDTLRQFLYFEESMVAPDPAAYRGVWHEKVSGSGRRKTSRNLWIYEIATGKKRYSVTTDAGAKIQPYFDVPPSDDPNVHVFTVQGESLPEARTRIWLAPRTRRDLEDALGGLDGARLESAIDLLVEHAPAVEVETAMEAEAIEVSTPAYEKLRGHTSAPNDDRRIQVLIDLLRQLDGA